MKIILLLLLPLLSGLVTLGQHQPPLAFDTSSHQMSITASYYYTKTDFSSVDTLALWNYALDTTYRGWERDSVKAIGRIIFWRTKPVANLGNIPLDDWQLTPHLAFEIYPLKDSAWCYKWADRIRGFSSSVPPNVGGDLIRVDQHLYFSGNSYLQCQPYENGPDFCRPVVNAVSWPLRVESLLLYRRLRLRCPFGKKGYHGWNSNKTTYYDLFDVLLATE